MNDPTAIAQGIASSPLPWVILGLAIACMYLFKAMQSERAARDKALDTMRDQLIAVVKETSDKSVQAFSQVTAIVSRLEDVIDFVESSRRHPSPVPFSRISEEPSDPSSLTTPPMYQGSRRSR